MYLLQDYCQKLNIAMHRLKRRHQLFHGLVINSLITSQGRSQFRMITSLWHHYLAPKIWIAFLLKSSSFDYDLHDSIVEWIMFLESSQILPIQSQELQLHIQRTALLKRLKQYSLCKQSLQPYLQTTSNYPPITWPRWKTRDVLRLSSTVRTEGLQKTMSMLTFVPTGRLEVS